MVLLKVKFQKVSVLCPLKAEIFVIRLPVQGAPYYFFDGYSRVKGKLKNTKNDEV